MLLLIDTVWPQVQWLYICCSSGQIFFRFHTCLLHAREECQVVRKGARLTWLWTRSGGEPSPQSLLESQQSYATRRTVLTWWMWDEVSIYTEIHIWRGRLYSTSPCMTKSNKRKTMVYDVLAKIRWVCG